jgi:mannose-6-phosphate isomerase-like protein (cupin superfamily)
MRVSYKVAFVSVLGSVLAGATAIAMGPKGSTEIFISAAGLAAKVQGAEKAPVAYEIPDVAGRQVLMIRRVETGDAEVHTQMDDTIVIESGTGKFRVGGTITGNHQTAPTEWRGGTMTGAREYTVSVGDLLLIPAGVPHQAVVTAGPFTYLAVKTSNKQTP